MRGYVLAICTMCLPGVVWAQSSEDVAAVQKMFAPLQLRSFEKQSEFCGMIGVDDAGRLVFAPARKGTLDSCVPDDPVGAVRIVGSYHTHGHFVWENDSEVPSLEDVWADMDEGVNGWVATPGGRLWYIEGATGDIWQICGFGCLPQDPKFISGLSGHIPQRMTLEELEDWFGE